ncbi:MAG: acyl-CoA dehydrogenase family protein, partial [Sciscionella sp.]
MPVARMLPNTESEDLLALVTEIARDELAPKAAEYEASGTFPRESFRLLGKSGLLGLPYEERWGGGAQPYEVYLQALEEIAAAWMTMGIGLSVHTMSCFGLAHFGDAAQRQRWLPDMLGGELLGGYSLSEPQAGSDAGALATKAVRNESGYRISGTKAWVTNGGQVDYYTLMARTSAEDISCFLIDADTEGLRAATPERKMGLSGSPTTQLILSDVGVTQDRRIGAEGRGLRIALESLNSGRLGIAACAVGLAQAALDEAVAYTSTRTQFGSAIIDFQGMEFLLADMAAAVGAARSSYLDAARRRDRGMAFVREASIAKLVATDAAMKVTTDAVQA